MAGERTVRLPHALGSEQSVLEPRIGGGGNAITFDDVELLDDRHTCRRCDGVSEPGPAEPCVFALPTQVPAVHR
jgi:hypothetical protein